MPAAPPPFRFAALLGLGDPPWIAGHRGAAGEELENTLPSFRVAVDQGADLVELDVQLTSDGALVVFHDRDLSRLAGRAGVVERTTLAELREARLMPARSGRREATGPPALEDVLSALPPAVPLNLELKRWEAARPAFARALVAALAGRARTLVSSFDWELLDALRGLAAELPLAPLASRTAAGLLAAAARVGAASVHCHRRLARRRLVEDAAGAALPLLAYTVNEAPAARALLDRGVAGLFTDFPGRLRGELAAAG